MQFNNLTQMNVEQFHAHYIQVKKKISNINLIYNCTHHFIDTVRKNFFSKMVTVFLIII